ncbi:MAG: hypothetical protein JWP02_135 [Acidimicrobiales bacterium]|nr:hypothetical protein [Acidimicrobiales bacterium]
MSPLPKRDRLGEYATKGIHLALRQMAVAPEQVQARRLAKTARERTAPSAGDSTKRVAVLSPRDWAAHVQWEGMIAQALRVRGADVSFITCGGGLEICDRANTWEAPPMPCATCTRYVNGSIDAHGFSRVALRDRWEHDDPGPWPALDEVAAPMLPDVEGMGLPLGQLVDIPVKWFLMGSQVAEDPLAPITFRRFLRSSRRVVTAMSRALDELRPDVVLMLNGLFFFEAICRELCAQRRIDVVTYERGLIKETLLFRRGAPACLLDVSDLWETWKDVALTPEEGAELDRYLEERTRGERTIDRFWGDARFESPERRGEGRLVSLFTNLTWDSAVIGQEVAFASLQDWVAAAVDLFERRPEHELVIRIHPAEVKLPGKQTREPIGAFLDRRFRKLPQNVRVIGADDPTSSYPLMEASDAGLVFTSTTGVELALRGVPVIVAGRSHYRGKGFTTDVSSPAEFEAALDDVLADPRATAPDPERARRYAYLFFFRAPVPSPGVEEHVLGLARLTVHDLAELAPGRDPGLDRICDGILEGGDFGPPRP